MIVKTPDRRSKAQIAGGVIFGLSAALFDENYDPGRRVEQAIAMIIAYCASRGACRSSAFEQKQPGAGRDRRGLGGAAATSADHKPSCGDGIRIRD